MEVCEKEQAMRSQHNNRDNQEPLSKPSKEIEDESIGELAAFVLESLEEGYKSDWEPFEIYAQKLRSHIHTDSQVFRKQFIKGYESLIDVLHDPSNHDLNKE
ncbi:conserved hypothetical protein [Candidatus Protochlamydia naegleriophila]|uniref:Uncharacterized protein n=2 Tax=Candidatus Protochlamydia naegleriophila TaxID=389348 RepID=A0A0U5JBS4_9BACT|nr:conserved hypothetical protein [Candidatus Protochlamydia naegleriophila]